MPDSKKSPLLLSLSDEASEAMKAVLEKATQQYLRPTLATEERAERLQGLLDGMKASRPADAPYGPFRPVEYWRKAGWLTQAAAYDDGVELKLIDVEISSPDDGSNVLLGTGTFLVRNPIKRIELTITVLPDDEAVAHRDVVCAGGVADRMHVHVEEGQERICFLLPPAETVAAEAKRNAGIDPDEVAYAHYRYRKEADHFAFDEVSRTPLPIVFDL